MDANILPPVVRWLTIVILLSAVVRRLTIIILLSAIVVLVCSVIVLLSAIVIARNAIVVVLGSLIILRGPTRMGPLVLVAMMLLPVVVLEERELILVVMFVMMIIMVVVMVVVMVIVMVVVMIVVMIVMMIVVMIVMVIVMVIVVMKLLLSVISRSLTTVQWRHLTVRWRISPVLTRTDIDTGLIQIVAIPLADVTLLIEAVHWRGPILLGDVSRLIPTVGRRSTWSLILIVISWGRSLVLLVSSRVVSPLQVLLAAGLVILLSTSGIVLVLRVVASHGWLILLLIPVSIWNLTVSFLLLCSICLGVFLHW